MTTNTRTRNYNNGKIYKIECLNGETNDIYIGSTTKEFLSQRMTKHREGYKTWLNKNRPQKTYVSSFDIFDKYDVDNCVITLIESVNANTLDELKAREAHYIRNMKCVNKVVPLRTGKEYREDNKEKIKEEKRVYYENNKEYFLEKAKLYCENNKEKLSEKHREYHIKNKDKIIEYVKVYYENNKDKVKEYKDNYYQLNKDKILEKQKVTVQCPTCNCMVTKCKLSRHNKTKSHIEAQEKLDAIQIV